MTTIEENIMFMHYKCAMRENASSSLICAMAQLAKPFQDAVAAALLSTGGLHAPVQEAQQEFELWRVTGKIPEDLDKLPGFGSAWYKGEPDPDVETFMTTLRTTCDEGDSICNDMVEYTKQVQEFFDKKIWPNAGLATALANFALKRHPTLGIGLVIQGRLPAWEELYIKNYVHRGF